MPSITERDILMLKLASAGIPDKSACCVMGISEQNLRNRWQELKLKTHARNRAHACAMAATLGLI